MFLLRRFTSKTHNSGVKEKDGHCRSSMQNGCLEEEAAKKVLDQSSDYIREGKYERALWLLEKAGQLYPDVKGVAELVAIAEVCCAAISRPCTCLLRQRRSPDWYRILKVDENSDFEVIKKRYRQLALLLHPDKNKHVKAEGAFKLVSEAYACLSDKKKRSIFNLERSTLQCKRCSLAHSATPNPHSWCDDAGSRGRKSKLQRPNSEPDLNHPDWVLDQEKLKVFRERARARVLSTLAKAWKERRSKWMEEFDLARERAQSRKLDRKVFPAKESVKDHVLQQHHQRAQTERQNMHGMEAVKTSSGFSSRTTSSTSYGLHEGHQKLVVSQNFSENLEEKRVCQQQRSKAPKNLEVLIRELREDLNRSINNTNNEKFQFEKKVDSLVENQETFKLEKEALNETGRILQTSDRTLNFMKDYPEERDGTFKGQEEQCSRGVACKTAKSHNGSFTEANVQPDIVLQEVSSSLAPHILSSTELRNSGLDDFSMNHSSVVDNSCPCADSYLSNNTSSKVLSSLTNRLQEKEGEYSRVLPGKDHADASTYGAEGKHLASNRSPEWAPNDSKNAGENCALRGACLTADTFLESLLKQRTTRVDHHRGGRNAEKINSLRTTAHKNSDSQRRTCRGDSLDLEERILQTQKQKSEELLKTLQRLREEAKSVAASLDQIRQSLGPEVDDGYFQKVTVAIGK